MNFKRIICSKFFALQNWLPFYIKFISYNIVCKSLHLSIQAGWEKKRHRMHLRNKTAIVRFLTSFAYSFQHEFVFSITEKPLKDSQNGISYLKHCFRSQNLLFDVRNCVWYEIFTKYTDFFKTFEFRTVLGHATDVLHMPCMDQNVHNGLEFAAHVTRSQSDKW